MDNDEHGGDPPGDPPGYRTSTIEVSIDNATTSSRAILAVLFERIRAAVHETRSAGDRPWDSGPVAVRWLEHEISPLIAAYEVRLEKTQTGQLHPCPLCNDGEAEIQDLPCIVEYSCGHRVSLALTTGDGMSEAQMASIIRRMQQAAASANPSLSRGDPDRAIQWTDDQLSMIASAIAGGQLLCCEHGEYTRETICTTRAQLEELAEWAHEGAGCTHIDLSRKKSGPHDASPYQTRIDCYLRNFMGFDHASRQS